MFDQIGVACPCGITEVSWWCGAPLVAGVVGRPDGCVPVVSWCTGGMQFTLSQANILLRGVALRYKLVSSLDCFDRQTTPLACSTASGRSFRQIFVVHDLEWEKSAELQESCFPAAVTKLDAGWHLLGFSRGALGHVKLDSRLCITKSLPNRLHPSLLPESDQVDPARH